MNQQSQAMNDESEPSHDQSPSPRSVTTGGGVCQGSGAPTHVGGRRPGRPQVDAKVQVHQALSQNSVRRCIAAAVARGGVHAMLLG